MGWVAPMGRGLLRPPGGGGQEPRTPSSGQPLCPHRETEKQSEPARGGHSGATLGFAGAGGADRAPASLQDASQKLTLPGRHRLAARFFYLAGQKPF